MKMTCVGRLFEGFEQGVEGGVGNLVGFVEDVDFVAVAGGCVAGGVAEFANLVDAAVGGGVDLDDVDGVALADFDAAISQTPAGLAGGALRGADFVAAVQGHGDDAGDGGFADAAVPREDVAVRDAVLGEGVHQGAGDVVLAGYVGEALRTVFSGQNLVTHE